MISTNCSFGFCCCLRMEITLRSGQMVMQMDINFGANEPPRAKNDDTKDIGNVHTVHCSHNASAIDSRPGSNNETECKEAKKRTRTRHQIDRRRGASAKRRISTSNKQRVQEGVSVIYDGSMGSLRGNNMTQAIAYQQKALVGRVDGKNERRGMSSQQRRKKERYLIRNIGVDVFCWFMR
eukprot:354392_1